MQCGADGERTKGYTRGKVRQKYRDITGKESGRWPRMEKIIIAGKN